MSFVLGPWSFVGCPLRRVIAKMRVVFPIHHFGRRLHLQRTNDKGPRTIALLLRPALPFKSRLL